ncbi:MAG TPA: hypothetical protein VGE29_09510 [Prosthecobacter sp.]
MVFRRHYRHCLELHVQDPPAKLEDEVSRYQVAARILAENPATAQIGALDVQALTNPELRESGSIITTLKEQACAIPTGWTSPNQAAQFLADLEIRSSKARQALGAAAGGRKDL